MRNIFLILFTVLLVASSNARVIHSVTSGSWGSSSTWHDASGSNTLPTCGDTIVILDPHNVTVSSHYTYSCGTEMVIYITGVISFGQTGRLTLPASSLVAIDFGGELHYTGNGNGNNAYIVIGNSTVWQADKHNRVLSGPSLLPSSGTMPVIDTDLLPIELAELKAEVNNLVVDINWATLTETNNDYFLIEKSTDGVSYKVIDRIEGAGNSNEMLEYETTDMEPSSGVTYYRLKQVDYDNKFEYFGPIAVNYSYANDINIHIYPNPVVQGNQISVNGIGDIDNATFTVYDIIGNKMVLNYSINDNLITFDSNKLARGTYIFHLIANDELYQAKFIVK